MAFNPSAYTENEKSLPIFLLLDVSGSMDGQKINALNQAVSEMISEIKSTVARERSILLCAIKFSDSADVVVELQPIENVSWSNLSARGGTELGFALKKIKSIIEDRNIVPSRSYRPAVILVSDGLPFDGWEKPMDDFIHNGRSAKCDRMAMLIGDRSAVDVMNRFLAGSGNPLFFAPDSKDISKFFKMVTMTTTQRTLSNNPDVTVSLPGFDKENLIEGTVVMSQQTVVNSQSSNVTVVLGAEEEDDE